MLKRYFNRERFARDVQAHIDAGGRGTRQRLLETSGISTGSFARFFYAQGYVKDIDMIYALADAAGLQADSYMEARKRDWIYV